MTRLASIGLVLCLAGCSTAKAVQLEPGPKRAAVPADSVRIYRTAAAVPSSYIEVAIVTATGGTIYADDASLINAMRKKAAALGANGLLLERTSVAQSGGAVDVRVNQPVLPKGSAVAIFVKVP